MLLYTPKADQFWDEIGHADLFSRISPPKAALNTENPPNLGGETVFGSVIAIGLLTFQQWNRP